MVDNTESSTGEATYMKSDLARAVETNKAENIANLNKSETVFYLCSVLGVEPPEAHPSEHNGTVPRSLSQKWATVLGDYADRNGTDAFHAEKLLDGEEAGEETGEDNEDDNE